MPTGQIYEFQLIFEMYEQTSTLEELGLHAGYGFTTEEGTLDQIQENRLLS